MTDNATNFVNPITFETLTGEKCLVDTFDRNFKYSVEHVQLAKEADLLVVAPASANIIAKAAHGLADDMLSTTILACDCPKLFAPAMNTRMYNNPVTQDNIATLKKYGMTVITPCSGRLACGDEGEGKLPEPEILFEHIVLSLTEKKLSGKKVLVTAGATREKIDPVRYISNNSSGKMGYALARVAAGMGADVTLVSGITSLSQPVVVDRIDVESAKDMAEAVKSRAHEQDIIIKAAAVADYTPAVVYDEKVKKSEGKFSIPLDRTEDILGYLGSHRKEGQFLCGFSMETENVIENSREKLLKKNIDMIVANDLRTPGAGFKCDTNVVTIITKDETKSLPLMDKEEVAYHILSGISELMGKERDTAAPDVEASEDVLPAEEVRAAEAPAVEVPVEEVKAESPTVEVPVEEVKAEAPAVEVPMEEVSAAEIPAENVPEAESPVVVESTVAEASVAEPMVAESPVAESPVAVESTVAEAPVAETPIAEVHETQTQAVEIFVTETPEEEVPEAEIPVEEVQVTEAPAEETPASVVILSEAKNLETAETAATQAPAEEEPEFFDEETSPDEALTPDRENESFFDEEFYDEEFSAKAADEDSDISDSLTETDEDSEFFKDNFEGEVFF